MSARRLYVFRIFTQRDINRHSINRTVANRESNRDRNFHSIAYNHSDRNTHGYFYSHRHAECARCL